MLTCTRSAQPVNSYERRASVNVETNVRHNWINLCDAALVPSQFNCLRCHTQSDLAHAIPAKIENIAQRYNFAARRPVVLSISHKEDSYPIYLPAGMHRPISMQNRQSALFLLFRC